NIEKVCFFMFQFLLMASDHQDRTTPASHCCGIQSTAVSALFCSLMEQSQTSVFQLEVDHGNYYSSNWYRMFVGQSSAQIPETCVQESRCSSLNRVWSTTPHPVRYNESVSIYTSYATDSYCYGYYGSILTRLCYGNFYVYKLPYLPVCGCNTAYCAGNVFKIIDSN
uniref:UMOD/GP2/OIT3-like D8C domain-containing protein n=1 Tax=Oryzias latipes TaxID=8090 RepID=A0A3P9MEV8_ORYLA